MSNVTSLAEISQALSAWRPQLLGLPEGAKVPVHVGPGITISGGDAGIVYYEDAYVKAIGVSGPGAFENNEDAMGVERLGNGSLLFHLADGMGGCEAGEIASGAVLEHMAISVGCLEQPFEVAAQTTIDYMIRRGAPDGSGSTYAGALLQGSRGRIAITGDSPIAAHYPNGKIYASPTQDSAAVEIAKKSDSSAVKAAEEDASIDTAAVFADMRASLPQHTLVESARQLLQYKWRTSYIAHAFIVGSQVVLETNTIDVVPGMRLFLYTDGVANVMSPIDIVDAFDLPLIPLHERARTFSKSVMVAQVEGNHVAVSPFRHRYPVEGEIDHYSYWAIEVKEVDS